MLWNLKKQEGKTAYLPYSPWYHPRTDFFVSFLSKNVDLQLIGMHIWKLDLKVQFSSQYTG